MIYRSLIALGLTALHASANLPQTEVDAAAFAGFTNALQQMVEEQSSDYYDAAQIVLTATQDECAMDTWMEQAAQQKQPAAQLYIANKRISGILLKQDNAEAIQEHLNLLKQASDSGYIPASIYYSTCMNAGLKQVPNKSLALQILAPAAAKGNKEARFKWLQLSGRLQSAQDLSRPEVLQEIDKGNDCVMMYASMLSKDEDTRIQNLQDAAALGNGDAYYELGQMVEQVNPKQSYAMMSKAAELHHPNAMAVIGGIESSPIKADSILDKSGADFKPEEGIKLLRLATMLGSPIAQFELGEQYLRGNDAIPQDKERAFHHIYRAACSSNANALLSYCYMLLVGEGCQADPKTALGICQELANRKVLGAELLFAYAHYKGLGVEANAQRAAELLEDLAALNQPIAYVYLAYITQAGGVQLKPDPKQAELYLRMAKIDLGDKAQQLYDQLLQAKDWAFQN